MIKNDTEAAKKNISAEAEELRHKLENLITIKGYKFDNEVLEISRKLDEILNYSTNITKPQ